MPLLSLSPVAVSFLLLAAHFMHAQQLAGVGAALAMVAMLTIRRPFVPWVVQIALALASLEWLRTALSFVQERQRLGQALFPLWGGVSLITVTRTSLLCGLLFRSARVKFYYQRPYDSEPGSS